MRNIWTGVAALLGVVGASSMADAQTLKMMKSLDAPHYDGQRTTWSPTSDIVNMFTVTDGKVSRLLDFFDTAALVEAYRPA